LPNLTLPYQRQLLVSHERTNQTPLHTNQMDPTNLQMSQMTQMHLPTNLMRANQMHQKNQKHLFDLAHIQNPMHLLNLIHNV
jgi:hypothetical protein